MAVFAVLADKANISLGSKIKELYPKDFYEISTTQWLVATDTTARSVADRLSIREGAFNRAIVVPLSGMPSGWQSKSMWDWLREKGLPA
jgi:hypothetical protein